MNCAQQLPPVGAPIWNHITNIREDSCTQGVDERQSSAPGNYATNNFFRWCESQGQYANLMAEPGHFYKPYRNACQIDTESVLRNAELTNKGEIYNLYTQPYAGVYMGAGARANTPDLVELESQLIQGLQATHYKACERTSGISINRFQYLPDYGNPQRVQHIIPVWVNGGEPTRDYVRRVNFEKQCLNRKTNGVINRP